MVEAGIAVGVGPGPGEGVERRAAGAVSRRGAEGRVVGADMEARADRVAADAAGGAVVLLEVAGRLVEAELLHRSCHQFAIAKVLTVAAAWLAAVSGAALKSAGKLKVAGLHAADVLERRGRLLAGVGAAVAVPVDEGEDVVAGGRHGPGRDPAAGRNRGLAVGLEQHRRDHRALRAVGRRRPRATAARGCRAAGSRSCGSTGGLVSTWK